jgi:hypothetical protein
MIEMAKFLDMSRQRLKPLLIVMDACGAAEAAPFQRGAQSEAADRNSLRLVGTIPRARPGEIM